MSYTRTKALIVAATVALGALTPATPAYADKTITEKTIHGCRAEMDELHQSKSKSTLGWMSIHVRVICDDKLPQNIVFQGSIVDLNTKKKALANPRAYQQKKQVIDNAIPYRGGKDNHLLCAVGHTYRITVNVTVAGEKLDTLVHDKPWEEPCAK